MNTIDHPIFLESIRRIKAKLGPTDLNPLEQQVLERLIHTSGDFSLESLFSFSQGACQLGLSALQRGALIVTDTDAIKFFERKCKDYDRWIAGMQSLHDKIIQEPGEINLGQMHKFI